MPINAEKAKALAYQLLIPMVLAVAVSISLFVIVSVSFMVLVLISMLDPRERSFLRDVFCGLLLLYFFMNLLSLTQTHHWPESLRGILKVLRQLFLCIGVAYVLDTPEKFKKLYPWIFIATVLTAFDAFFQGWTGTDFLNGRKMTAYFGAHGRFTGPFKHANDFSAYLVMTTTLFLGMVLDGRRFLSSRKYFLYFAGFAIALTALLGTYSRTGWFAFIIVAVLMGVLRRSKAILAALMILVVWGIFFSPPLVKIRLQSIWDPKGGTVSERKVLWNEAARMIRCGPLLGMGVNTYAKNEPHYKTPGPGALDCQYAHNGYLQMAAEIGLLGLFSFLAALLYFLFVTFKAFLGPIKDAYLKSSGLSLVLAACAFLMHSAFDTGLQSILLVNFFWICIGFAWAGRKLSRT